MTEAYSITAGELARLGRTAIPPQLRSAAHLIYSSPATLAFNSPGAQGFGVKRAGLAVPGSVMLLVSPGCCGRNTAALGADSDLAHRFFYLLQDETDIVTGRHLARIPDAVCQVCAACHPRPTAVMICITCVDALLGTDMERVCRQAAAAAGVPVVPCYMYALTREGRLPPMAAVRQAVYSLLKPLPKDPAAVNLLGFFSPLAEDCELYALLHQAGLRAIRELSRCRSFDEYLALAGANFNLVLNPEARTAAADLEKQLGIPSVELARLYQADKVLKQYQLFAQAIGVHFDPKPYCDDALAAVEQFRRRHGALAFAVGEWANADPFELAVALLRYGFTVSDLYGTVGDANFIWVKRLAELSPATRIFSNLSPTMLFYPGSPDARAVIGRDAQYYNPRLPGIPWAAEIQPFGFAAIRTLFRQLDEALTKNPA